ncbi:MULTISPECIES: hypothetical protein [unclassified Streptomyces]|uniref:hypothetical protein n=1 Tax=unclassified Streptomyces TaxID=2593676 RepID=UPI001BED10A6|nr:hypothetical protein [Streptomyces sp. ISL-10]MBT2369162.1 hypothetical protein [Streptomyces sp. ISL-10]
MSAPQEAPQPAAADDGPKITRTDCDRCGTRVAGIDGRYACGVCGWVNHWSEGHRPLPPAEADVDFPGRTGAATQRER